MEDEISENIADSLSKIASTLEEMDNFDKSSVTNALIEKLDLIANKLGDIESSLDSIDVNMTNLLSKD